MLRYALGRLAALVPVWLVVSLVVFLLIHLIPGDAARVMVGGDGTEADVQAMRERLGLNQPLAAQYLSWLGRALRGDLGQSIFLGRSVTQAIAERLEPTISLTAWATLFAVLIGLPVGILSAMRAGRASDQLLMSLAFLLQSLPSFWTGLTLIVVFSVTWNLLPSTGYASFSASPSRHLQHLALPAIALGIGQAALIARMARSSLLEVLGQDYVRTAQAKGLGWPAVVTKHALRNALIPVVTVVGLSFAVLLAGAIVIETVFNLPGVGRLVMQSILRRDYPVIQGVLLFITTTYVLVNLAVDLVYGVIDPRVRHR
ncbi:MAG: ABC transporter permease [Candidatus Rokuibacteriota bacterium]|jgi:peptide/nickel transport system permease protein